MAIKIKNTKNVELMKMHFCLVGPAGTGKTHTIKTIPGKPFMLSADCGELTLAGTDCSYLEIRKWAPDHQVEGVAKDEPSLIEAMRFITSDTFTKQGFDWLIIDSVSVFARILISYLEQKNFTGFDLWAEYDKQMNNLLNSVTKSSSFNSISIYEIAEKENSSGLLEKKFGLKGSIKDNIPYFYDFVFATKRISGKKGEKDQYAFQTCHKDGYNFLKGRGVELADYEPANISHIVNKLKKGIKA